MEWASYFAGHQLINGLICRISVGFMPDQSTKQFRDHTRLIHTYHIVHASPEEMAPDLLAYLPPFFVLRLKEIFVANLAI